MKSMRVRSRAWVLLPLVGLLLSPVAIHVANASVEGPFSIWWDYAVWNNRYAGNTVQFDFYLYNVDPSTPNDTINSVKLVTPWQTFQDKALPTLLCEGCSYVYATNVTIPATQHEGSVNWTVSFTGAYKDGSLFCQGTGSVCSETFSLYISPNPYILENETMKLQQTVTSLDTNVTSLASQVSSLETQLKAANTNIASLQSQLTAAQANITSLQGQVSSYKGEVSSLQTQLTTAQNNITSLQASLSTAKTNLQGAESDLASARSSLSATQSQLNATLSSLASTKNTLATYANVYLPVGIGVPSVIAVLLAVLYLRKGSRRVQ